MIPHHAGEFVDEPLQVPQLTFADAIFEKRASGPSSSGTQQASEASSSGTQHASSSSTQGAQTCTSSEAGARASFAGSQASITAPKRKRNKASTTAGATASTHAAAEAQCTQSRANAEPLLGSSAVPNIELCQFERRSKRYKLIQVGCWGGDGMQPGILIAPIASEGQPKCGTCKGTHGACCHTTAYGGEFLVSMLLYCMQLRVYAIVFFCLHISFCLACNIHAYTHTNILAYIHKCQVARSMAGV